MTLSAAQQRLIKRMKAGAHLAWLSRAGKYQLVDGSIVRTVDHRTVEQLVQAKEIERDVLGACRLTSAA